VDEGHAESVGEQPSVDRVIPHRVQGNAAIAFAGALRLDCPAGLALELHWIDDETLQDHRRLLTTVASTMKDSLAGLDEVGDFGYVPRRPGHLVERGLLTTDAAHRGGATR
jgi:hypothetical protein